MENFEYYVPTRIYFGKGQLKQLSHITEFGKRVLVVYGGGSVKRSGLYDQVMEQLSAAGVELVKELGDIAPNPRISSVRSGMAICREYALDVILAVGGGSVIDAAKVIAAGMCYDGDVWDIVKDASLIQASLPVATILTLAATGSEMDINAVISNPGTNEKLNMRAVPLRPVFSILDPTLTFSVPPRQTAAGAADILSHVMENYFNHVEGCDLVKELAEGIMRTTVKYGPIALREPENYTARANLMWASSLALNDLLCSGASCGWSAHPMEHILSAHYDITHADGLAILTPNWMEYILSPATAPDFAHFGHAVFGLDQSADVMTDAKAAIRALRDFNHTLGLPATLRDVGIGEEKLRLMAEETTQYLSNCYVPLTAEDVYAIFRVSL